MLSKFKNPYDDYCIFSFNYIFCSSKNILSSTDN